MQRQKAWRTKNPDYDKNRYATDPEYAESRKAARRERYANDPEYRALEKQRRREFAQDNPDYKEKRNGCICGNIVGGRRRRKKNSGWKEWEAEELESRYKQKFLLPFSVDITV